MPPHKPVTSLFHLSLSAVGRFVHICARHASQKSFVVGSTVLPGDTSILDAERRASRMVDASVANLRQHLFSSVPWDAHQQLADVILLQLANAVHNSKALYRQMNASPPESVHEIRVLVRFAGLIVHPGVRSLNLAKMPKMLRDELYRHLEKLTGLTVLNLGSGNGESGRRKMFLSLRSLVHLTTLALVSDCQNETLAVVGQNCPQLRTLDVNSSSSVSDVGAAWLLRCQKLSHLNLYHTSLSVQAYAQLLLGLPTLKSVGRCDVLGQVLEYIDLYNAASVSLALEDFHSRDMSYRQLKLLIKICPSLTQVNLYVDEDMGNLLEPLQELERLRELTLLACNFYTDGVDKLLRAKGHDLTQLHLEHIDELDMNALCCIAESCSSLRKLVFFSCDFVENFGQAYVDKAFAPQPFKSLEKLVCVSESAPNIIKFLLTHAENLRSVQFGSTAWFDDATVAELMTRGRVLRNVEEIRILRSYELTMKSVELLLHWCPKLRVLAEMDGWESVDPTELAQLRNRITAENLDLDTFTTWNVSA